MGVLFEKLPMIADLVVQAARPVLGYALLAAVVVAGVLYALLPARDEDYLDDPVTVRVRGASPEDECRR